MPRRYSRPPLVEALAEFQFVSGDSWDWTVPGLMYARIRDDYPVKREQSIVEMRVTRAGTDGTDDVRQGIAKMQFLSPDELSIAQVAPNALTVNRLTPYPGWDNFRETILTHYSHYCDVARPTGLRRAALRYIDRITLPREPLSLQDFFYALPGLPTGSDGTVTAFFTVADVEYNEPSMKLRVSFGSGSGGEPNQASFLMDIEASSERDMSVDSTDLRGWLDAAHERLSQSFDASFTDRTHHEIFGELQDD